MQLSCTSPLLAAGSVELCVALNGCRPPGRAARAASAPAATTATAAASNGGNEGASEDGGSETFAPPPVAIAAATATSGAVVRVYDLPLLTPQSLFGPLSGGAPVTLTGVGFLDIGGSGGGPKVVAWSPLVYGVHVHASCGC